MSDVSALSPSRADDGQNPEERHRKRSIVIAVGLVVWVLALIFGWALRPIDDTVPVVVDPLSDLAAEITENPAATPLDAPRAQLVHCNTLFDTEARDLNEPLPMLRADYVYARTPCETAHRDARLNVVVNIAAIAAVIVGWLWFSRREAATATTPSPPR